MSRPLFLLALGLAWVCGRSAAAPTELRHFDLVVYGGTPGGVAHAVRAAREGLDVLLVSPMPHLGGLLASGLSTMDTLYNGARAPLYDELRQGIHDFYRERYGADSEPYRRSLPGRPKTKYESCAVEQLIDQMVRAEARITLLKPYYPTAVEREGRELRRVTFRERSSDRSILATAAVFSDCSYEGDLMAVAQVAYRWGRESRDEFDEEHAGRIFMRARAAPSAMSEESLQVRGLNLAQYNRWYEIIRPESTGAGDKSVQGYNMRTVITRDPANRLPVEKPANYDRDEIARRLKRDVIWATGVPVAVLPNQKAYLNLPQIIGSQHAYVEGDWAVRQKITDDHVAMTLALVYFMQHDESVAAAARRGWLEWGLPRDEFPDNNHLPYEIYARETRRLAGRFVFTENDSRYAPQLRRAPVHADSISTTDWFLDSHSCTPSRGPGNSWDGALHLSHITAPGQVPYRALLPPDLDNFLVPVCASSTHIGWGVIRLEPTWMSIGEAAAHATVLAIRQKKAPANIDPDELVRVLAERRIMVSFFNDVEVDPREPWYPAVQYFGTQGFFGTFDARPLDALTKPLAEAWAQAVVEWRRGDRIDPTARARRMLAAEDTKGPPLLVGEFAAILGRAAEAAGSDLAAAKLPDELQVARDVRISRGTACRLMYVAGRKR